MTDQTETTGRSYAHEPDRYGYGGGPADCPHCGAMSPDYCPQPNCDWEADISGEARGIPMTNSGDGQNRNKRQEVLGGAARERGTHVAPSAPVVGSGQHETTGRADTRPLRDAAELYNRAADQIDLAWWKANLAESNYKAQKRNTVAFCHENETLRAALQWIVDYGAPKPVEDKAREALAYVYQH